MTRHSSLLLFYLASASFCTLATAQQGVFTIEHVDKTRNVGGARISPDGRYIAYTLSVPRKPYKDDDGTSWTELHVVDTNGVSRPFITGKVNVGGVDWTPDGREISFLDKRGDDKFKCIYVLPIDGGEARRVVKHEADIGGYSWSPDGKRAAFLAKEKEDKDKKKLKDKGFKAEVYEEDWRPTRVWIAGRDAAEDDNYKALDLPGSASMLQWSPAGDMLSVGLSPTPLIDDEYMRRKVHIVDVETGKVQAVVEHEAKLESAAWSPDGKHLAILAGQDIHDPSGGCLFIASARDGKQRQLLADYTEKTGHIQSVAWQDADTIMYVAQEHCDTTFSKIDIDGSNAKTIVPRGGPILSGFNTADDGMSGAFVADSPAHPGEVFYMKHGDDKPRRLTDSNPWLANVRLAKQEVVTYKARDGLELDGILIRPLDEQAGTRYPLIVSVHGGPEAHLSNGWVTRYSNPGQMAAAQGYAMFYPNYRASTGRGVVFSKLDQGDYAGAEFDDLVDGAQHLAAIGLVDKARVGVTGGSYGGYASAWCATKLTEHFAAAVMFVGISDLVSKVGTTDIPNEMFLVHARKWPWDDWEFFRDRSPLTHTQQARTPILIMHGKDDTRVHPSQSIELYRYLKTLGKVPVRLVMYPGEGHGNRKAASKHDYCMRLMQWMDHYLKGPGGDPPPYELDYGFDDKDKSDDDADNGESKKSDGE